MPALLGLVHIRMALHRLERTAIVPRASSLFGKATRRRGPGKFESRRRRHALHARVPRLGIISSPRFPLPVKHPLAVLLPARFFLSSSVKHFRSRVGATRYAISPSWALLPPKVRPLLKSIALLPARAPALPGLCGAFWRYRDAVEAVEAFEAAVWRCAVVARERQPETFAGLGDASRQLRHRDHATKISDAGRAALEGSRHSRCASHRCAQALLRRAGNATSETPEWPMTRRAKPRASYRRRATFAPCRLR